MKIFLIGPGGVGKTTVGKVLSEKIYYKLIDLDYEFTKQIGNIGEIINRQSLSYYHQLNSQLFFNLLKTSENSIFVLSSGFLVNDEGVNALHLKSLKDSGISILLLPSSDNLESEEITVDRQMGRGQGYIREHEYLKIHSRLPQYLKLGDLQIFSQKSPENIADLIIQKLEL